MTGEHCIIRQSIKRQLWYLLSTAALIVYYFVGPYEKTRSIYQSHPTFTIVLGTIFFSLFFYFLREFITRKAEIILTSEGIELRDKGFFYWNMIESFKTIYYRYSENHEEELVLHFKEFDDVSFNISDLEKRKDELADLILKYGASSSVYYLGHQAK